MAKELNVSAIKNGTVIDHIPVENTFKILQLLDINKELVTVGNNFASKSMSKKGVIKVADKELNDEELDKIALLAPNSTVCIIKNYKVHDKYSIHTPDIVEKVVKCFNPKCVTRNEPVKTRFLTVSKAPLKIKCAYCERVMGSENIELN